MTRRNFYGVLRVYEEGKREWHQRRKLYHGGINHGLQLLHPSQKDRIVSYFSAQSGLGIAFRHPARLARLAAAPADKPDHRLKVGMIGLGIGVAASWGLPGDRFRFYEINPGVVHIADEFFTVLTDSPADAAVVEGDGRISLERELWEDGPNRFDILVVDAFSGDAIPVHLITEEAFELYFKHLRPDGILALHISNRHIDLKPVVHGQARRMGIPALLVDKDRRPEDFIKGSQWALLTRNRRFLRHPRVLRYVDPWPDDIRSDIIWTDDYSNLFTLLK